MIYNIRKLLNKINGQFLITFKCSSNQNSIGACHKIAELDKKKRSDSEHVAYEFRTKRISAIGIDDEILQEVHKFPFPIQQMLVNEFSLMLLKDE